jgi:hypothetical protein
MTFLIISIVVFYVIAYLMPKRLSKIVIYATTLFALLLATLTDLFLDVKYLLYWFFTKEVDWLWLIILFGIYPAVNVIYLNFFPLESPTLKKICYILFWSVIIICYEWGAVNIGGILHYGKWNIGYSALAYPFILTTLYGNFLLVRNLIKSLK